MSEQPALSEGSTNGGGPTGGAERAWVRDLVDGQVVEAVFGVRERELRQRRNGGRVAQAGRLRSLGDRRGGGLGGRRGVVRGRRPGLRSSHQRPLRSPSAVRPEDHRRGDPLAPVPTSSRAPTSPTARASRWSGWRPICASCWRRSRTPSFESCSTASSTRAPPSGPGSGRRRPPSTTTRRIATGSSTTRSRSPRR